MKARNLPSGLNTGGSFVKLVELPVDVPAALIVTHDVVPASRSRTNQSGALFVSARPATMFVACVRNNRRVESGLKTKL